MSSSPEDQQSFSTDLMNLFCLSTNFFSFLRYVMIQEPSRKRPEPLKLLCLLVTVHKVSAATACATWSAAPMEACASLIVPTATSACAHSASGEHSVKTVSQLSFPFLTHLRQEHRVALFTRGVLKVESEISSWSILT